jgi:hypothetical protein
MSNLSDLLPAGAGGKQVDFVATGTLSSGQTVALKTDGTVEAIVATGGLGTKVTFNTPYASWIASTYDSNANRVVIAYKDGEQNSSAAGKAIVGTISGTSISFGTEVTFNAGSTDAIGATFDSNTNKVVIGYQDNGNSGYGTAIVGTVSGTSISFGTAAVFAAVDLTSGAGTSVKLVFESSTNKIIIAYVDNAASDAGKAVVGTVSGTSISFGSSATFSSGDIAQLGMSYDSNLNKALLAYRNGNNSYYGTAVVGTVSGTSISFGTEAVYQSNQSDNNSPVFDSNSNQNVIAYGDSSNAVLRVKLANISGTNVTFGNAATYDPPTTAGTYDIAATFDSNLNKIMVVFRNGGNSNKGSVFATTITGSNIAFDTTEPVVFNDERSNFIAAVFDTTANTTIIAYQDVLTTPNTGGAVTYSVAPNNNTSFIGITDAAISSAASGSVTIKGGISSNVTGLTANSTYYVQTDGTLTTATSTVLAGKALSSTSINLDYTT